MANDDDGLRGLWQAQAARDGEPASVEALMRKESKLARAVRMRNLTEYVAAALVIAAFGGMAFALASWVMKTACVLVIVAAVFVVRRLHRDGTALPEPAPEMPLAEQLAHYRAQLSRQRDLLRGVPRWYIAPFLPGLALFIVGRAMEQTRSAPSGIVALSISVAIILGVLALIVLANRRAERQLEREISALEG